MARFRFRKYWAHQWMEVKTGGIATLLTKFRKTLGRLIDGLFVLLAVPIVCILRLLFPIAPVRFGFFFADRIGHFAFDVEYFLASLECDRKSDKYTNLFFLVGKVANQYLLDLAKRELYIHRLVRYLYLADKFVPFGAKALIPARHLTGSRDRRGLYYSTNVHLNFTSEEESRGQKILEDIGIKSHEKVVCLIVRDSAYLNAEQGSSNWEYHSYRDTDIRNYEQVVDQLIEKGYWVLRMGKLVSHRLSVKHPRFVDYANCDWKSEFLDIWLLARSTFCVSTSTGLDSVADVYRKPIAFVNFLPLAYFQTWSSCVVAPANLVWNDTGRRLNCEEHLIHSYMRSEDYLEAGIRVSELTSQDILDVVLELEERISGHWESPPEEYMLQEKFWELYKYGDDKLIKNTFKSQDGVISSNLRSRMRPKTAPDEFIHPKAVLSHRFLEKNPEFLNRVR